MNFRKRSFVMVVISCVVVLRAVSLRSLVFLLGRMRARVLPVYNIFVGIAKSSVQVTVFRVE
jgi:hypothetical protein